MNGILLKIQRAVGGLVAHHVQMALQDQARLLLVSGCGRCLDEHIAHLVLTAGKAVGLGELHAVVAQCLFVVGGVRNAADLLKVIKTEAGSRLDNTPIMFPLLVLYFKKKDRQSCEPCRSFGSLLCLTQTVVHGGEHSVAGHGSTGNSVHTAGGTDGMAHAGALRHTLCQGIRQRVRDAVAQCL